uniref:Uncharacterized protein n=1 Tax=Anguilla anguilla TaxID=7936 RepID=A0A0E9VHB6_ANGAN
MAQSWLVLRKTCYFNIRDPEAVQVMTMY